MQNTLATELEQLAKSSWDTYKNTGDMYYYGQYAAYRMALMRAHFNDRNNNVWIEAYAEVDRYSKVYPVEESPNTRTESFTLQLVVE